MLYDCLLQRSHEGSYSHVLRNTVRRAREREHGGIGITDIHARNSCQLLQLIHRLHQAASSSWARWICEHACIATMEGDVCGHHWDALRTLRPIYQAITTIDVGMA